MNNGELIIYKTEDGSVNINLREIDGTVWLTQSEISDLFDKRRQTISEHIENILSTKELDKDSVCRNFLRTADDGKNYNTIHYNLDLILAVGYRVNSPRGIQFRHWANTILKEYLIKGFAMNDERLKMSDSFDYFDEWLARIRDIRASEKRFYQKVRDLYATSVDYDGTTEQARDFFKNVQNKMLWAVTGKTAAELIKSRSSSDAINMGLTTFRGSIVRKKDISTSKNYLQKNEIEELNRIVTMYLDYAEDQVNKRKTITMKQWMVKLENFLKFNGRELLTHAGQIKMKDAQEYAAKNYEIFDAKRKKLDAIEEDKKDLKELEAIGKELKKNR